MTRAAKRSRDTRPGITLRLAALCLGVCAALSACNDSLPFYLPLADTGADTDATGDADDPDGSATDAATDTATDVEVSTDAHGDTGDAADTTELRDADRDDTDVDAADATADAADVDIELRDATDVEVRDTDLDAPELDAPTDTLTDTDAGTAIRPLCRVGALSAETGELLNAEPLDTIVCRAGGDLSGIIAYEWFVDERPSGSTSEFESPGAPSTDFFLDSAGRYVIGLALIDASATRTVVAQRVTIVSRPASNVLVQLTWHTPADLDETDTGFGAGADLDLHLLNTIGCWESTTWDCHFRQRTPDWGLVGRDGEPTLELDDTDGAGPEIISFDRPEAGITYEIGVHYYNDHDFGASFATVRIYTLGELRYERRDVEMPYTDYWWVVGSLEWPWTEVTAIDLFYDDVPPCP